MESSSTEFEARDLKTQVLRVTKPSLNDQNSTATGKTSIIIISLSIITLSIMSIITVMTPWLDPQPPVIRVNSLSASKVNISRTKLAAKWVANVSLINPNFALDIAIDRMETVLLYKEDDALSLNSVEGFQVHSRKEKNDVTMTFATTGYEGDQPVVEYTVLREREKDITKKKSGTLRFSLRMSMMATYKTRRYYSWFAEEKHALNSSYIVDLDVRFDKLGFNNNNGSLIKDGRRPSGVSMMHIE